MVVCVAELEDSSEVVDTDSSADGSVVSPGSQHKHLGKDRGSSIDANSVDELVDGKIVQTVAGLHSAQRQRTQSEDKIEGSAILSSVSESMESATIDPRESKRSSVKKRLGNSNTATSVLMNSRSVELLAVHDVPENELIAESGRVMSHSRSLSNLSGKGDDSPQSNENTTDKVPTIQRQNRTMSEQDIMIDPLLAEGLPIEDFQVTQKVMTSAMNLLRQGKISQQEYNELVKSDFKYRDEALVHEEQQFQIKLKKYFGESWTEKKERILHDYAKKNPTKQYELEGASDGKTKHYTISQCGQWPRLDLLVFIVKSNDDLRQETFCLQIMELCQEIFQESGLSHLLFLEPYRIVSTSSSTGFVQVLPNTISIDGLKKTEGFESLPAYFEQLYGTSVNRLHNARMAFVTSLAAYSLLCYILQIKDRHNGNILLDSQGHIIHIDFGFLLGIAPGGNFSIESAPFKLTEEMLEVIGGLDSPYFNVFVKAFSSGFLALRAKSSLIISAVEIITADSTFPCLFGKDTQSIIDKLKGRFRNELSIAETIDFCLDLITNSYSNLGTKQYDNFQWYSNGIVP
jgi:phosphatidylinositol 4-kinase